MLDKDDAVQAGDVASGGGLELYEEVSPDGKMYDAGKSVGKPMKNVVIASINGPMSVKASFPREAFVDMVKKYFGIKGY